MFPNLAGKENVNEIIKKELFLAGIKSKKENRKNNEVSTNIIGISNGWVFIRAWRYYVATSKKEHLGLPENKANALHFTPLPFSIDSKKIYGEIIRVAGHCDCPEPKGWLDYYDDNGNMVIIAPDPKLKKKIKYYKKKGLIVQDKYKFVKTKNDPIIKYKVINTYHIDDIIGLKKFAETIKK